VFEEPLQALLQRPLHVRVLRLVDQVVPLTRVAAQVV